MRRIGVVAAGWIVAASAAAAGLPKVGVMVDRNHYEVVEPGDNGFDETFYPRGQDASQWSERLSLRELGDAGDATPEAIEAAQRAIEQSRCPALSGLRVEAKGEALPIWQWVCPATAPALTTVQWVKPVLAGGRVYFAQAQFRGPAPAGRIPAIPEASWDQALGFLARFEACKSLTDPGCVPPEAIAGEYGDAPIPLPEQAEVRRIAERGLAMHYQDQLAWHATDHVRARRLFNPGRHGGGFLSVPGEGRSGRTYFVTLRRDRIDKVLQVDTAADGSIGGTTALPELPAELVPRWRARQAALASPQLRLCSATANTLVLPVEDGPGWWVYVMSSSTTADQVFLGGHNRVHVSADGATVLSVDHSARGCLDFDAGALRALKQGEGAYFSHLVSPLPWETDVMQSLTYAIPLTRVTESGVWRIEGDQLRKLALQPAAP